MPGYNTTRYKTQNVAMLYFYGALALFVAQVTFGLVAGLIYVLPNTLSVALPFNIVRMIHTNAVAYGYLINIFIAVLYWTVPRLTGYPLLSLKLSWLICWAWQAIIAAAAAGIILGDGQAIEWGETPTWVDHFAVLGVALLVINVGASIVKTGGKKLYVSLWYFTAMAVAGRELQVGMNTFELMLYRSGIGFVIVVLLARMSDEGFAQLRSTRSQ